MPRHVKPVKRYVALLRGVSPTNAKMPDLKRAFESAGFSDVKTVLSSGNVVFSAPAARLDALARQSEQAMAERLGKTFLTFVRSLESLQKLLASEPYAGFRLRPGSKRVVTFLERAPKPPPALPVELDEASVLKLVGTEVFSVYVPGPKGPVFMTLLEKTFGKNITTRTWDTVLKLSK